ncbi:hypothetical protein EYR40_008016 [Pleurotus pulmonarius]|nr:hypothetical protein EYR38_007674 [Pleurotus pulmonarius]KAF4597554.1 hypothetical protein EYR40_008016 [Pleurotus pulmonarius]
MLSDITVNDRGIRLAFIDSGAPKDVNYATIFAFHGIIFTSPIFAKVSAICLTKGVRFVAINRRGYRGSTPFSEEEVSVLNQGTDAQKSAWLLDRSREYASFIDIFIERYHLPAPSPDGKSGGIGVLGWSAGTTFSAALIANISSYTPRIQQRLSSYLRVHLMQDPPSLAFGLPLPPKTYSPQVDQAIPAEKRSTAATIWLTSYFNHGDLGSRDPDVLEYVLPALFRVPTIWCMTAKELSEIIEEAPSDDVDFPFMLNCMAQTSAVLQKSAFDEAVKRQFPYLQTWEITGDHTASFGLAAFWNIEDKAKESGQLDIHFRIVPGTNHFAHWDDPEKMADIYLEAFS